MYNLCKTVILDEFFSDKFCNVPLKALDTFGNCQRPVFVLGVSKHMPKITTLWKKLTQFVIKSARE